MAPSGDYTLGCGGGMDEDASVASARSLKRTRLLED